MTEMMKQAHENLKKAHQELREKIARNRPTSQDYRPCKEKNALGRAGPSC